MNRDSLKRDLAVNAVAIVVLLACYVMARAS